MNVHVLAVSGAGNAFALVDERDTALPDDVAIVLARASATELGVDGLLVVGPSAHADARLRIVNADGSAAEMCGNGMRCVGRYLAEHDGRDGATVETLAGPITTRVLEREPAFRVAVGMRAPVVGTPHEVAGLRAAPVDVGNPHVVIFLPQPGLTELDDVDLHVLGPRIATDPRYPGGTNVHFAVLEGDGVRVRHWERGAGATLACGTGAVACAAAAAALHGLRSPVRVDVPGGRLVVRFDDAGATLEGEAQVDGERVVTVP